MKNNFIQNRLIFLESSSNSKETAHEEPIEFGDFDPNKFKKNVATEEPQSAKNDGVVADMLVASLDQDSAKTEMLKNADKNWHLTTATQKEVFNEDLKGKLADKLIEKGYLQNTKVVITKKYEINILGKEYKSKIEPTTKLPEYDAQQESYIVNGQKISETEYKSLVKQEAQERLTNAINAIEANNLNPEQLISYNQLISSITENNSFGFNALARDRLARGLIDRGYGPDSSLSVNCSRGYSGGINETHISLTINGKEYVTHWRRDAKSSNIDDLLKDIAPANKEDQDKFQTLSEYLLKNKDKYLSAPAEAKAVIDDSALKELSRQLIDRGFEPNKDNLRIQAIYRGAPNYTKAFAVIINDQDVFYGEAGNFKEAFKSASKNLSSNGIKNYNEYLSFNSISEEEKYAPPKSLEDMDRLGVEFKFYNVDGSINAAYRINRENHHFILNKDGTLTPLNESRDPDELYKDHIGTYLPRLLESGVFVTGVDAEGRTPFQLQKFIKEEKKRRGKN